MFQGSNFSIKYLWQPLTEIVLRRDCTKFAAPVFFILGRRDMQVVASVSADYFAAIEAPRKELFWLEEAGHFAPFEQPAEFDRILVETVRPLAL
jgi:pimeloyl-ACP methyl ester carboxylesterase